VEETASGAVACQILDILHPGAVPMHKVNWSAKQSFEFVANYKILQTCFTKLGIDRHVDVDRLISGKYMDNLEFMQWYKAFFERQVSDLGDYDAYAQRCKGKGGASYGGGNVKNAPSTKSTKNVSVKTTSRQASSRTKAVDETPKVKSVYVELLLLTNVKYTLVLF
jgi:RP/EB family microtubule-associated protein